MINDEDRGRDRQSSDYSQPSKRKRISTGNKPYEKVDYTRRSEDSGEKRPLYSSDKSSNRPQRDDSRGGGYPRENYRGSTDGNRGQRDGYRGYSDGNREPRDGNRDYPDGNREYPDGNRSYPDNNRNSSYDRRGDNRNSGYERNGNS